MLHRITLSGIVALLVALVAVVASLSASAAFPGNNGRIVFGTNRDGNDEIYAMNADGTNRVNLTRDPAGDLDPHASPGGNRIAFASNRDGNNEIYVMNADGTGLTRVTNMDNNNRWPSWTNDGRILFQSGFLPNRDVYVVNPDGTGLTNLTPESSVDYAWAAGAPRGPLIALSRYTEAEGQHIYTLNLQSGVLKRVTPAALETFEVNANWSPSGNDIVYRAAGETDTDLFSIHRDGTGVVRLTNTPNRAESTPSFSPDGIKIVFTGCTELGDHCVNYVVNADGSGETQVTLQPTAPYLDTFTGNRIDPFWHSILTGTGSSLAQVNGRLEETIAADAQQGGPYDNIDAHIGTNCKLSGDFDVQADYSVLTWPGTNGVQVTLHAFEPEAQALRESQLWGEQYGAWLPPTFTSVPTSDLSGSLRLSRVGMTITSYYRSGIAWVPIASGTRTLDDTTIGLDMSSFMNRFAHQEVRVAWDNFRISSGQLTCPSWWADRTPDWQPISK
jgi:Tol biopolymer transport system component